MVTSIVARYEADCAEDEALAEQERRDKELVRARFEEIKERARRQALDHSSYRSNVIERLARANADRQCGGRAGPKSVAMWRNLAERLSEGISIDFESTLQQRLDRFRHL